MVRMLLLVLVAMFAVLSADVVLIAKNAPALAAQGDPAAKAEIVAAFDRLNSVPSYRMKTSAAQGTTVLIEVVRPDKRHYTAQSPTRTYESITIGTQTRERVNMPGQPTGWRCTTNARPLATIVNLDRVRKDLTEVVRKPDAVIDGMPVRAYGPTSESGSATTLYVDIRTGLPRRIVLVDKPTGKTATIDFYDYGAPIAITLPPCG